MTTVTMDAKTPRQIQAPSKFSQLQGAPVALSPRTKAIAYLLSRGFDDRSAKRHFNNALPELGLGDRGHKLDSFELRMVRNALQKPGIASQVPDSMPVFNRYINKERTAPDPHPRPNQKVFPSQWGEIIALRSAGWRSQDIAKRFGVGIGSIRGIYSSAGGDPQAQKFSQLRSGLSSVTRHSVPSDLEGMAKEHFYLAGIMKPNRIRKPKP